MAGAAQTGNRACCGQELPELRPPETVMRLSRLGAFFPHRLSFMRVLIRRLAGQRAAMTVPVCALDKEGYGHVVLCLPLCGRIYSLIAYSRPLADDERTDRVIATRWDASFCLFDGIPDEDDIAQLGTQVTRQEAGRYDARILVLSRANKSVRLFASVVDALASGRQPDRHLLQQTGYLMRTTAVYGNGKFGIADRDKLAAYDGLEGAFQAEMLCVFLIREFTLFLADYCAHKKGGDGAVRLSSENRRYLGVGNSTGLGMAPFLVTHPCLLNSWIMAREVALARVCALPEAQARQLERLKILLERARRHCDEWQVADRLQMQRILCLRAELATLAGDLDRNPLAAALPFADLQARTAGCSAELQELVVSLLIELAPEQVDALADCMASPLVPRLDPSMRLSQLSALLTEHYSWVDENVPDDRDSDAQFWYVSAAKLEPRLGLRYEEPGAECEMPFNIPAYIRALQARLVLCDETQTVASFLLACPEHRHIIRRVQSIAFHPYGEIRDNLVAASCRPIDLLRCKLSFFGAGKFDPKSDKWTRITLYQGAPTADQLASGHVDDLDDWLFALAPPAGPGP